MLRAATVAVPVALGMAPGLSLAEDAWREKAIDIAKATTPHEWPFTVENGELKCIIFGGQRLVLFTEPDTNDPDWFVKNIPYQMPRSVIVSTNPFEVLASLEDADLFLPFDADFVVLIKRLTPYAAMGQALCEVLLAGGDDAGDED
jgi:hypothetical protein